MSAHFLSQLRTKYVLADYQKWRGKWVHWSRLPEMKVNPQGFHMDPAGIYLFPESFKSIGGWHKYQYKFIVEVPDDLKVLDLSTVNTPETAIKLLDDLKVTDGKEFPEFRDQIEKSDRPIDAAWEYLQRYFGAATGEKRPGAFNKRLRSAGYEAVFDDTGSIHSSEVQLLLLDPRRVKSVKREDKKGSGFELIKDVYDLIVAEAKKYGEVSSTKHGPHIKKEWESWTKENQIKGSFKIWSGGNERDSEKYVYVDLIASPDSGESRPRLKDIKEKMKTNLPASKIILHAGTSKPSLEKAPWSLKKHYEEDIRDVKLDDIKEWIKKVLHYVFVETPPKETE